MLPKKERIPRKMFSQLKEGGKTVSNSLFLMKYSKKDEGGQRFSFSVSKKMAKDASARNKIRRVGYEAARKLKPTAKGSFLAHIQFKRLPENKDEISEKLESVLKEAKIIIK